MNDINNYMEERVWDYLDGLMDTAARNAFEQELEVNTQLKEKLSELQQLHKLIHSQELMEPSMRFAKNVMEAIALQAMQQTVRKQYINNKVVWAIGIGFIALFGAILVYSFASVNWSEGGNSNIRVPGDKLVSFDWANQPLLTAFMMLNVVMGLYLVDYYFSKKRKGRLGKTSA